MEGLKGRTAAIICVPAVRVWRGGFNCTACIRSNMRAERSQRRFIINSAAAGKRRAEFPIGTRRFPDKVFDRGILPAPRKGLNICLRRLRFCIRFPVSACRVSAYAHVRATCGELFSRRAFHLQTVFPEAFLYFTPLWLCSPMENRTFHCSYFLRRALCRLCLLPY